MKNLDWGNLSFGYMKTDYNVRCYYRDTIVTASGVKLKYALTST